MKFIEILGSSYLKLDLIAMYDLTLSFYRKGKKSLSIFWKSNHNFNEHLKIFWTLFLPKLFHQTKCFKTLKSTSAEYTHSSKDVKLGRLELFENALCNETDKEAVSKSHSKGHDASTTNERTTLLQQIKRMMYISI